VRLFVALQIPVEVREALAKLVAELRQIGGASGRNAPKWVPTENLHVTLKFIGEIPTEKLGVLRETLSSVRSDQQVTLDLSGLGFFPNEKRPRVFWAGMNVSPNLQTLAQAIDKTLATFGFPLEQRPFAPHLTLARLEPPGVAPELQAAIQKNVNRSWGSFTTNEFHLIESKLKPSGAEYTTVQSFRFALAEA
jgi:2'-5' RNA ligase